MKRQLSPMNGSSGDEGGDSPESNPSPRRGKMLLTPTSDSHDGRHSNDHNNNNPGPRHKRLRVDGSTTNPAPPIDAPQEYKRAVDIAVVPTPVSITVLPLEIRVYILLFLEPRFVLSHMALLSSAWNQATRVSSLWKHHAKRYGWDSCPKDTEWFDYFKRYFSPIGTSFRTSLTSGYRIWFNPRNGGLGIFGSIDGSDHGSFSEFTRKGEPIGTPLTPEDELRFLHLFSDYETDAVYGITQELSLTVLRSDHQNNHVKTMGVLKKGLEHDVPEEVTQAEGVCLSRSSVAFNAVQSGDTSALWLAPFPAIPEPINDKTLWFPEPTRVYKSNKIAPFSPLIASDVAGSATYIMDYEGNTMAYYPNRSDKPPREFTIDLSELQASGHEPEILFVHPRSGDLLLLSLFEENDAPRAARLSVYNSTNGSLVQHHRLPWTQVESISINRAGTLMCLLSDNHYGPEVLVHLLPYPLPYELKIATEPRGSETRGTLSEEEDEEDEDKKRAKREEEVRAEDELIKHVVSKYNLLP